jgi:hypothetical protein
MDSPVSHSLQGEEVMGSEKPAQSAKQSAKEDRKALYIVGAIVGIPLVAAFTMAAMIHRTPVEDTQPDYPPGPSITIEEIFGGPG